MQDHNAPTQRYFCIHGHFYQPPRENPLIEQVELQPSALPSHDWNERVFVECYAPNGASRILDGMGRIDDIVNNYAYMSFNIGPTLFSWLEEKHPYIYKRILEADSTSCQRLEGHGNAMAQVYNHVIMPLATEEQRRLQIEWGKRDFARRFGRDPEGMWLAETAINMATVVSLIRAGIKYTVLAPTQALKVRALNGDTWTDVSHSNIDPRRPYRIFPVSEDGMPLEKGHLDVFFYDGGLSHGVGFDHLLTNGSRFADRISQAFDPHNNEDQLVTVCTDGESYGHHEAFGDMCAAYVFQSASNHFNMVPVNYAWYLAKHPPQFEARLKNSDSEGTAWSCAHGVGRWKIDCGCENGGQHGWNQKWRAPFREALDILYRESEEFTEKNGPKYFKDWKSAKDTALLSWQFDLAQRQNWWTENLLSSVKSKAERAAAADLIDVLRFSNYTYTSCAWFFSDISGIETLQNLKYALRVLQILEGQKLPAPVTPTLRSKFLSKLSEAISNVEGKTGEQIFLEIERESLPTHAYLALGQWVKDFTSEPFAYAESPSWKLHSHHARSFGLWTIRETVFQHRVSEAEEVGWLVYHQDGFDADIMGFCANPGHRLEDWEPASNPHAETIQAWMAPIPSLTFASRDLPLDIKEKMAVHLKNLFWEDSAAEVRMQEWRLGIKEKQFQRLGWPLPQSISQTLYAIESFRLVEILVMSLRKNDIHGMQQALDMAKRLRDHGIITHLGPAKRKLNNYLVTLGRKLLDPAEKWDLKPFFVLLDLLDNLKLNSERYRIENLAYPIHKALKSWQKSEPLPMKFDPKSAILLLDRLNFNTGAAKFYFDTQKAAGS